jgi:hypothetical protein
MMSIGKPTIHDIVAQLTLLTEQLRRTASGDDRRVLLKQFRALLDQADQVTGERMTDPRAPRDY